MQSLGVVWLDVEAFFISPGAFSPMRKRGWMSILEGT